MSDLTMHSWPQTRSQGHQAEDKDVRVEHTHKESIFGGIKQIQMLIALLDAKIRCLSTSGGYVPGY